MLTLEQLLKIMPEARSRASVWLPALNAAMAKRQINTPLRAVHFLTQIGHESAHLAKTVESLNYRADRLPVIFPKYFDAAKARQYGRIDGVQVARQPEIAEIVYGGRKDLGNTQPGDGWKFRGRGLIQITGRANYTRCGSALGVYLLDQPELLERPDLACESAAWFWETHGCNELADKNDLLGVTKRVNGGTNGLDERTALQRTIREVLL